MFTVVDSNIDKINQFLGKKQLLKLAHKEIGHLNNPMSIKEV